MWKVVLGVLIVVGMAGVIVGWRQAESTRSVSTVSVDRGTIDSRLLLTGTVINDRTVTLTALLDGEITTIFRRVGDVVEAGEVLADLDSRQARAMLEKASAELVLQEQAVEASTRNLLRIETLSQAGSVSTQDRDDGRDALLEARAALHAARATLTLNQLLLDNAQIRAPFAGTVIEQSAETGQWLEAGTPLFKAVATEGTVIEAEVSASDWSRISFRAFVLDGSTAREPQVRIGLTSLDAAEVIEGLAEGEPVIVPAGLPLQDGQSVQLR